MFLFSFFIKASSLSFLGYKEKTYSMKNLNIEDISFDIQVKGLAEELNKSQQYGK